MTGYADLAQAIDQLSPAVAAQMLTIVDTMFRSLDWDAETHANYVEMTVTLLAQRARGKQVANSLSLARSLARVRLNLDAAVAEGVRWFLLRYFDELGTWLPLNGERLVQADIDGLAWELASEFGLTSDTTPNDDVPGAVLACPSDDDQAGRGRVEGCL